MYHCQILEHEDRDVMRAFVTMPAELMRFMSLSRDARHARQRTWHRRDVRASQQRMGRHGLDAFLASFQAADGPGTRSLFPPS